MSTSATLLPTELTEKLNQYAPRDATIFYDEKLGWVCERRSQDARPEPDENQSPMENLGPFGTLSQTLVRLI